MVNVMPRKALFGAICLLFSTCNQPDSHSMKNPHPPNHLVHETSPYLLQHAYNPVEWYTWSDEAWEKAKKEDKLVLISIGYSSCHWCHVMEKESFENDSTAALMNEHFVCIKVDREERPDIDQVYMSAVQLMTGSGGWPLNCFCLPDGRPIYGGTYFPNVTWNDLLLKLASFYAENKTQAEKYAAELTEGIRQTEFVNRAAGEPGFVLDSLKQTVSNWKISFDNVEGGPNRAPKFPLPNNYDFLLHYYAATKDDSVLFHVKLTLDKMAYGGIYDQVGGGFARYSTDSLWKAPHFEKMLYDNAQLVSLYSHAWQLTKNDLYKRVVQETLEFVRREMTSDDGGFYSALDADSEGEEGKYYVWEEDELKKLLGDRFPVFASYYNVNKTGYWEHSRYILLRKESAKVVAEKNKTTEAQLSKLIADSKKILLEEREKRVKPGLDDKQLTSWNALMIKGYCDAYDAFGKKDYLDAAIRCANLFLTKGKMDDGGLRHQIRKSAPFPSGKAGDGSLKGTEKNAGFLDDYSFTIEALIALYQSTFDERWLNEARTLANYTLLHFFDESSGMFYYTSDLDAPLIARKKEINDNVIPASNSSMAKVLFYLGIYFEDEKYSGISARMLHNVQEGMPAYGSGYSNWGILFLHQATQFHEIVVAGSDAEEKRMELNQHYLPNKILAGSVDGKSKLSLLEQRFVTGKTLIYICENKACKLPTSNIEEAILQLK